MYNVNCTTTDRSALSYPCTGAYRTLPTKHRSNFIQVNASFVADLSFQRWPQRALVEHKYPRKVFNWKKGKIWKQCPSIADKTTCTKIRRIGTKHSEDTDEAPTNSGLIGFQTVLISGIYKLHSGFFMEELELLYNYELPLLHPDSCDAQSSWQKLSQNLFRSSLDFLIKYLLRPPVLVKSSLVHVYFSLHHNLCKPTILWQNH